MNQAEIIEPRQNPAAGSVSADYAFRDRHARACDIIGGACPENIPCATYEVFRPGRTGFGGVMRISERRGFPLFPATEMPAPPMMERESSMIGQARERHTMLVMPGGPLCGRCSPPRPLHGRLHVGIVSGCMPDTAVAFASNVLPEAQGGGRWTHTGQT